MEKEEGKGGATTPGGTDAKKAAGVVSGSAVGAESSSAKAERHEVSKGSARVAGGISRRSLCIGAGSVAVLLGLGGLRYAGHNSLNHPPGGQDESHLVSACIRCERCFEACPRKVIAPADIEDGLLGMRTPELDFTSNYCDFCTEENGGNPRCVSVCPTGALTLPADAQVGNTSTRERGNVIIGLASIDEYTCLAFRDTGCRSCYDACCFDAIRLEGTDTNPRPYVFEDACYGCGACESVCKSLSAGSIVAGATERAIVVRPLDSAQ